RICARAPAEERIRGVGCHRPLPAHECSQGSSPGDQTFPPLMLPTGAQFASLAEHAPVGFVVADRGGSIRFANEEFGRLIGHDPASTIGKTLQDYLPPGVKMFYENQLVPMLHLRGFIREISLELLGSDGRRTPVFINAALHGGDEGNSELILISVFEAQQRRAYEKELLRARREFEQLAEVVRRSSDAILRISPDGRIESWNTGAEQIFAYSEREALGKAFAELFEAAAAAHLDAALVQLGKGIDLGLEAVGIRKDRRRVELSVSLTPHLDA